MEEILYRMRYAGWRVACHNDYKLDGAELTFWLFTHPSGVWVKGEGRTDLSALRECELRAQKIVSPEPSPQKMCVRPGGCECVAAIEPNRDCEWLH